MSGGTFEYVQSTFQYEAIDKLKDFLENKTWEKWAEECPCSDTFTPDVIAKIREGYSKCCEAYIYLQRIDWLLAGDDGKESFFERLEDGLKQFKESGHVPESF